MGYMNYAIGITTFIVLLTMVITAGGFNDYINQSTLDKYNVTKGDLKVSPNIPEARTLFIDIENDIYEKENVTVVNVDSYFNGSQDYDTEKAIVLEGNNTTGYVSYNIPDAPIVNTKTQKTSSFVDSRTHLWEGGISGDCVNSDRCTPIRAESSTQISENTSIVTIEFDEQTGILSSPEPVLYDINAQSDTEKGLFGSIVAWLTSAGNSMVTWIQIIVGLPSSLTWLGLGFGFIALLIIIEWLTW